MGQATHAGPGGLAVLCWAAFLFTFIFLKGFYFLAIFKENFVMSPPIGESNVKCNLIQIIIIVIN